MKRLVVLSGVIFVVLVVPAQADVGLSIGFSIGNVCDADPAVSVCYHEDDSYRQIYYCPHYDLVCYTGLYLGYPAYPIYYTDPYRYYYWRSDSRIFVDLGRSFSISVGYVPHLHRRVASFTHWPTTHRWSVYRPHQHVQVYSYPVTRYGRIGHFVGRRPVLPTPHQHLRVGKRPGSTVIRNPKITRPIVGPPKPVPHTGRSKTPQLGTRPGKGSTPGKALPGHEIAPPKKVSIQPVHPPVRINIPSGRSSHHSIGRSISVGIPVGSVGRGHTSQPVTGSGRSPARGGTMRRR